eukprot:535149_1
MSQTIWIPPYPQFVEFNRVNAPSYMSQFVSKYDTSAEDYEWYVDHIRPGMQHYADCVDKGDDKACVDLIHDNEAWTVTLNGFYHAIPNDCPTNAMAVGDA